MEIHGELNMVPKHKRTEHSYEYIANARGIRQLLLITIHKLNNTEDAVEMFYRQRLLLYGAQLTYNIRMAHDIYVVTELDFKYRRLYQTRAIGITNLLMEEITYLFELFPKYTNQFTELLEKISKESALLKGWRKSTDKIKDKFEKSPEYTI